MKLVNVQRFGGTTKFKKTTVLQSHYQCWWNHQLGKKCKLKGIENVTVTASLVESPSCITNSNLV